jgi:UDP-N-acetylmuramate: L-alanyl-gamma-D-glutamyl-meso-diaminopimelate ligase
MKISTTKKNDVYLMGIGGTGIGAFAGLLKKAGYSVRGSDSAVYSPMKEKLSDWKINYKTPYCSKNIRPDPDLVIIGNVIRSSNEEAQEVAIKKIPRLSFPQALNKLFLKNSKPIVACGTHGKTTCTSLLAHALFCAGKDPGFLVGGIPINFGESARLSSKKNGAPFVIEGDEYDTAYFDKQPKFLHYSAKLILATSLEFDHADIYENVEQISKAFSKLFSQLDSSGLIIINSDSPKLLEALKNSSTSAQVITYGKSGTVRAADLDFNSNGISFTPVVEKEILEPIEIPLFGKHNLSNALGCFALLNYFGLSHKQIKNSFLSFKGVKRRFEKKTGHAQVVIDDFAHHPTAVRETIIAAQQNYPQKEIWAIFEPRSATSCSNIFQEQYISALINASHVLIAPKGRKNLGDNALDTKMLASSICKLGGQAKAFESYQDLKDDLFLSPQGSVLLFMSNGNFDNQLNDFLDT